MFARETPNARLSKRLGVSVGSAVAVAALIVPITGAFNAAGAATVLSTPLHYQFGPSGTPLASGYKLDSGAAFSSSAGRGWESTSGTPLDMTWAPRLRSSGTVLQRPTIQATSRGAATAWHVAIANGTYSVTVGVGDASYVDSVDTVSANGVSVVKGFVPTSTNHFKTGNATVSVTGGKLVLNSTGGSNVKINYVDVVPAVSSVPTTTSATSPAHMAWFYSDPAVSSDVSSVVNKYSTYVLSTSAQTLAGQVAKANPSASISQYFLLDQIIKPAAGTPELHNNAAYQPGDFNNLFTNHPDWFLHDSSGKMIVEGGNYYRMDPGNADWRAFWTSRIKAANTSWTGVFADNTDASMCGYHVTVPKYTSDASYTDAIQGFVKYAYSNYFSPAGKTLMLNLTNTCTNRDYSSKYTAYSSSVFHEGWLVDWHTGYLGTNSWNAQLAGMEAQVAAGKGVVAVAQGSQTDYVRQKFAYASYLLVQSPKVSFRYSIYTNNGYEYNWWYSDYDLKLGTAKAARYLLSDGITWRRDYSNGYVTVNSSTHAATIIANS